MFVFIAPFDRRREPNEFVKEKYPEELYDAEYPYGKYKLEKEDGANALNRAEEYYKNRLRELYAEQTVLPPFDILYGDIKSECLAHAEKHKLGLLGDDSRYISDLVYDGKVKYTEPYYIVWQFYDTLGRLFSNPDNCLEVVETLTNNTEKREYDHELHREPFEALLPHLISATPTFIAHCHSGLKKEFRFRFNEVTRAWLAEHYKFGPRTNNYGYLSESDGYAYGLENLTFFNGDKVLFYQCSHESMQYDHLECFDD